MEIRPLRLNQRLGVLYLPPNTSQNEAWWDFKAHRQQHRLLREIEKTCEEVLNCQLHVGLAPTEFTISEENIAVVLGNESLELERSDRLPLQVPLPPREVDQLQPFVSELRKALAQARANTVLDAMRLHRQGSSCSSRWPEMRPFILVASIRKGRLGLGSPDLSGPGTPSRLSAKENKESFGLSQMGQNTSQSHGWTNPEEFNADVDELEEGVKTVVLIHGLASCALRGKTYGARGFLSDYCRQACASHEAADERLLYVSISELAKRPHIVKSLALNWEPTIAKREGSEEAQKTFKTVGGYENAEVYPVQGLDGIRTLNPGLESDVTPIYLWHNIIEHLSEAEVNLLAFNYDWRRWGDVIYIAQLVPKFKELMERAVYESLRLWWLILWVHRPEASNLSPQLAPQTRKTQWRRFHCGGGSFSFRCHW
eukprot:symbB.v1.2.028249.t2/scaffold2979.1/size66004/2